MGAATLEISGPGAEVIAAELAVWWKAEMGGELRPVAESPAGSEEGTRTGDPVAVASLVVSVVALAVSLPGGVLATADLAKRVEVGKKLARLADWVRGKRKEEPKLRIAVVSEAGRSVDVAADAAQVIEALGLGGKPAGKGAKGSGGPGGA